MFAAQGSEKVAKREARFDRLVVPNETAIRSETARNRGPGELKLDAVEPLGGIFSAAGLVNDDRTVLNANFREGGRPLRFGLQRPRQRLDQSRPVRASAGQEAH